jgi:hypothetical protein
MSNIPIKTIYEAFFSSDVVNSLQFRPIQEPECDDDIISDVSPDDKSEKSIDSEETIVELDPELEELDEKQNLDDDNTSKICENRIPTPAPIENPEIGIITELSDITPTSPQQIENRCLPRCTIM